jgi:hypothetical protein
MEGKIIEDRIMSYRKRWSSKAAARHVRCADISMRGV